MGWICDSLWHNVTRRLGMFGTAVAKYVQTPLFVLNSKYDTWQGAQIISAGKCASNISTCSANTTKFWVDYGRSMLEFADALPARHGVYIHNCTFEISFQVFFSVHHVYLRPLPLVRFTTMYIVWYVL